MTIGEYRGFWIGLFNPDIPNKPTVSSDTVQLESVERNGLSFPDVFQRHFLSSAPVLTA